MRGRTGEGDGERYGTLSSCRGRHGSKGCGPGDHVEAWLLSVDGSERREFAASDEPNLPPTEFSGGAHRHVRRGMRRVADRQGVDDDAVAERGDGDALLEMRS